MDLRSGDTIFALSTGTGRAALAVVRVSGEQVRFVLETMAGPLPPPRRLVRRSLHDPATGERLDDALAVFFPGPASFTGEDCAELHIHGGLAVRTGVLQALAGLKGCRPAEPGEFARRALSAGKMNLAEIEGLADLIDAETSLQRRQALRHLEGAWGDAVTLWSRTLLQAMALCEAALDFSDEADVGTGPPQQVFEWLTCVHEEIGVALERARQGERLREGYRVAITGPVNAGKSSLLNALARREAAIVSDIPGTTRDAIEVRMDLEGLPVVLIDTAGLRDTADPVESIGIARARRIAAEADLVLLLSPVDSGPLQGSGLTVGTKLDLGGDPRGFDLVISSATGEGLDGLMDAIRDRLGGESPDSALVTRERHRIALIEASSALERALARLEGDTLELAAEDLRLAVRSLGRITGAVGVEDVLGAIFSTFCIGK